MRLYEIQPNLATLAAGIDLLIQIPGVVLIDDGKQQQAMENALNERGLSILVMVPEGNREFDKTRGAVKIDYTTCVWVRTNPKIMMGEVPRWNPLAIEDQTLTAVMRWSKDRNDFGFTLTEGAPPETDWTDTGNFSRLMRFSTNVHFQ